MLDASIFDGQLGARDSGQPDQRRHFNVIRADAEARAAELAAALDSHGVGADAGDLRTQSDEELGEILHVRFGCSVAQHSGAFGDDGGAEGIFGGGNARLIEEDIGSPKLGRLEFVVAIR